MKIIDIEATEDTPKIYFNKEEGKFEMSGRSMPEEVIGFYAPILEWIDEYTKDPNDLTILKCKLDYINSASQRAFLEVFYTFIKVTEKNKKLEIEWYFIEDDDEMRETGEEYSDIIQHPIKLLPYMPE